MVSFLWCTGVACVIKGSWEVCQKECSYLQGLPCQDTLVLQVGSWTRGQQPHTIKKIYTEKTSNMLRMGKVNRRQPGYNKQTLIFGTWNVWILFKTRALISLISQLKLWMLNITALQETRWQGKDRGVSQTLGIQDWRRWDGGTEEWRCLLREARAKKGP